MRAGAATAPSPQASPVIFRLLINSCWFAFRWGLAVAVLLVVGVGGYLYLKLDDEIRRFAHATLAEHYPEHRVSVGSARFVPGQGISLFDVRLGDRRSRDPLLRIDELRLLGDFDIHSLASGERAVRRIEVRRPTLRAVRDSEGRWGCASLWPPPSSGGPAPPLVITGGALTISDAAAPTTTQPLTISGVDVVVSSEPNTAEGAPAAEPPIKLRGTVGGALAGSLKIEATLAPDTGAIECSVEADNLRVTDDLLTTLPGADVDAGALAGLRVDLRVEGRASVRRAGHADPITWTSDFRVKGGGLSHPRLPRPVSSLELTAHAAHDRLQVAKLTARLGEAQLSVAGDRRGWSADAPAAVTWRLDGLTLDEELRASLPGVLQGLWSRFRPSGTVDATGSATFDGKRLNPKATVTCRGVSFEDHENFPYRLSDATGALRYHDRGESAGGGRLDVNLIAQGEGRPIRVAAEFRGLPCVNDAHAGPMPACPLGWIEIRGDALRVTDALITALPESAEKVAKQLRPRGEFSAFWRVERATLAQPPTTRTVLTAKDCTAQFDRFPYPLRHIAGSLNEQNGRWWFENVAAQGAAGQPLSASGVLDPPPPGTAGPHRFRMRLGGGGVPMDNALRGALPASAQQAWDELRPRGRIDFTADVFCQGPAEPRISLVVTPHQRDLAIEPRSFPYRMEGIDGRFVFADKRLTFESARSRHGQTEIEGSGVWAPAGAGGWRLELTSLAVDRLDADHDFRLAAPIGLRRVLSRVDPQGSFGVHNGRVTLVKPPGDTPIAASWDMEFDFHQADLSGGLRIEDATGSVRLAGKSEQGKTVAVGELEIDTLFWNGLQLTNVRGPLWCDEQQCLLGAAAAARQQPSAAAGAPPRRVTFQAYGGEAGLNAQVVFDTQPRYGAAVSFRGVDLERFTSEYGRAETPLSGKAEGALELQGLGLTVYGVGGTGELHVREADFGELPVLVALFKALRGRAPDKTAFDGLDARFRLQGEHVGFEQLDLRGDAFSLDGRGEARLDRSLDLTFHSVLARSDFNAPVLRALVGQASEQLLTIRVGGTINEPQVRRETLPMVGNVLRQFQQEQSSQPDASQRLPARRY